MGITFLSQTCKTKNTTLSNLQNKEHTGPFGHHPEKHPTCKHQFCYLTCVLNVRTQRNKSNSYRRNNKKNARHEKQNNILTTTTQHSDLKMICRGSERERERDAHPSNHAPQNASPLAHPRKKTSLLKRISRKRTSPENALRHRASARRTLNQSNA